MPDTYALLFKVLVDCLRTLVSTHDVGLIDVLEHVAQETDGKKP